MPRPNRRSDDDDTPVRNRRRKPNLLPILLAAGAGAALLVVGSVAAVVLVVVLNAKGQSSTAPSTPDVRANQIDSEKVSPPTQVQDRPRNTAPRPSDPPKSKPPWVKEAEEELAATTSRTLLKEPLAKPDLMTQAEYQIGMEYVELWSPALTKPEVVPQVLLEGSKEAHWFRQIMPRAHAALVREGWMQTLALLEPKAEGFEFKLDTVVGSKPSYRVLKDREFRTRLLARAPWVQRQKLYADFAKKTGDKVGWSLTHPFDELSEAEMTRLLDVLDRVERNGLGGVDKAERSLILRAGAIDYFRSRLSAGR
jgi:hypothetical protein